MKNIRTSKTKVDFDAELLKLMASITLIPKYFSYLWGLKWL
jgi:hypothetical protein